MLLNILKIIKNKVYNTFCLYCIGQSILYICICKNLYNYRSKKKYKKPNKPAIIKEKTVIKIQPQPEIKQPEDYENFDSYVNIDIKDLN